MAWGSHFDYDRGRPMVDLSLDVQNRLSAEALKKTAPKLCGAATAVLILERNFVVEVVVKAAAAAGETAPTAWAATIIVAAT